MRTISFVSIRFVPTRTMVSIAVLDHPFKLPLFSARKWDLLGTCMELTAYFCRSSASRTHPEGIPKTEHINNQKIDTLFEP